jgi:imidazole glycerol-phosphate synthase subunit HisF
MKKKRVIPVLLLKDGWLVQSRSFVRHQNLGNPITAVRRLSEWASDELIYLDISRGENYDMRRDDQGYKNRSTFLEIVEDISKESFMPTTLGGKIKTLKDIEDRLKLGADKIVINTEAFRQKGFIDSAAKEFGSQCIVVSIDAKLVNGHYKVFVACGQENTGLSPAVWARTMNHAGAGEILINSIDRDGQKEGYDINLIEEVSINVECPVIACGGVGEWEHFYEAFEKTSVDAVAAANIFHYTDQSVYFAKKYLYEKKVNVRKPDLLKI